MSRSEATRDGSLCPDGSEGDEAMGTMDSPGAAVRCSRSDSGSSTSRRKGSGVVRALRELGKPRWLPSPLDAAARWLTPTYEIKNEDFRRLFKSLPPNAMLLDDYSCALQRDILVHGRMYVSQEHVSFYANIFGWETIVVAPLKKISSITREKTAHVFPNALQILLNDGVEINGTFSSEPKPHGGGGSNGSSTTTGHTASAAASTSANGSSSGSLGDGSADFERPTLHNKLWFTSFVSRDTSHTVLMKAWQNVLVDSPLSPVQLRNFACRCWGEKPDVSSDVVSTLMSGGSIACPSDSSEGGDSDSALYDGDTGDDFEMVADAGDEDKSGDVPGVLASEALQEADDLDEPVECGCTEHFETYLNETFNCPVDHLFQLLFTNSEFYKVFCRQHKTIDLRMQEWTPTQGDGQHREVTYTLTLNKTMGPKFSPTTETQHCLEGSLPGKLYRVDVEVCNGGIPYGDVFCTEHRYCLTRLSRHQSQLHVGARIHYRKSCWGLVKTFIERHCFQGMESYYKDISNNLHDECLKLPAPAGGTSAATTRHSSRSPSLSGSLASIPCDKTPTPSLHQEPMDANPSSEYAVRKPGNRRVSTPDGGPVSKGTNTSSAPSVDSTWSLSNVLMLCLLLALIVNGLLLADLLWTSTQSHSSPFPPTYEGLDDEFQEQREQWRRSFVRRQQLLDGSYNPFKVFASSDPLHYLPPVDDGS